MDFPLPHIHAPLEQHTHTAIFLHGRGSNGPEFCEDLFTSLTSNMKSLPDSLPSWRWVFPTAKTRYSSRFQEDETSWFDVWSTDNIEEQQELSVDGLRESVSYILKLLTDEIERVDGDASRVFLCGISQGMATTLWTFFCAAGQINQPLGGIIGFCGWLPFSHKAEDLTRRQQAMELLQQSSNNPSLIEPSKLDNKRQMSNLFRDIIDDPGLPRIDASTDISILSTPVLLSHGRDDPVVSIRLGHQAARILQYLKVPTEWHYYSDAEANGHWIKEPQGFDQMIEFIEKHLRRG
jgi:predicted esterase